MNKKLLDLIIKHKATRYGLWVLTGIILGAWVQEYHPDWLAKVGMAPEASVVPALAALWLSHAATKERKRERLKALYTPVPVGTVPEDAK